MKKLTLIALASLLLFSCGAEKKDTKKDTQKDLKKETESTVFYKEDLEQGSILERAQVDKLTLKMRKSDVMALLGSPSIIDPFHLNQWDYINHSILFNKDDITYRLTLIFKGDLLDKIDASGLKSLPEKTRVAEKIDAKTAQKIAQEVAKKLGTKVTKKAIEKTAEKTTEKTAEKLADTTEKSADKTIQKTSKTSAEKTDKQPTKSTDEKNLAIKKTDQEIFTEAEAIEAAKEAKKILENPPKKIFVPVND